MELLGNDSIFVSGTSRQDYLTPTHYHPTLTIIIPNLIFKTKNKSSFHWGKTLHIIMLLIRWASMVVIRTIIPQSI